MVGRLVAVARLVARRTGEREGQRRQHLGRVNPSWAPRSLSRASAERGRCARLIPREPAPSQVQHEGFQLDAGIEGKGPMQLKPFFGLCLEL